MRFLLRSIHPPLTLPLLAQTIAAAFSQKSPFAVPLEKQDELGRVRAALAAPAAATVAEVAAAIVTAAMCAGAHHPLLLPPADRAFVCPTLCLPTQTIAAAFSHKSPFAAPLEKQDELGRVRAALAAPAAAVAAEAAAAAAGGRGPAAAAARAGGLAAGQQSDQLLLVAAFEMWRLTGAAAGDKAAAQVGVMV